MSKKTAIIPLSACLLMLLLVSQGCNKIRDYFPNGNTPKKSIAAIVSSSKDYSMLKLALERADLLKTLDQPGTFTVFVPDNSAFEKAGATVELIESAPVETLKNVLLFHVIGSKITASQIPEGNNTAVTSLLGAALYVSKSGSKVSVNGSGVTRADIEANNGVIHGIDRVLVPPAGNIVEVAKSNPALSYLVAAVVRASQGTTNVAALLSGDGPLTVFAPTNQAFINAGFPTIESINAAKPDDLTPILAYHVITDRVFSTNLVDGGQPSTFAGETLTIDLSSGAAVKGKSNTTKSKIGPADIVTTNGVVHVIDQVLLP
ncbi:fasciclin domain-containing protein [Pollutibacter soli]|uniref:fasciclin domain-containing protein n=1 Tax=Pollutibacter soli TaxID=3034157 RepID=UPI0030141C8E